MIECMLAAPASGSGKTAMTCALLAALEKRGLSPCAFKCGPDYIDPMFHRSVLGVESHNLDLFFCAEANLCSLYRHYTEGHGAAVTEGVMGFYDGVGGTTDTASAWHLAYALSLPVLLVLRPKGASLTLAAQVKGLLRFRENNRIVGILLNDCSPMLAKSLSPMLEKETGLPVLGFLPHMPQAEFESRHLGLLTAGEIKDLTGRIDVLAAQLEQTVDVPRLLELCDRGPGFVIPWQQVKPVVKIAVARDESFCFAYEESLDTLRSMGAELVFFSPLRDRELPPDASGLYLPGGYPELHAKTLSANKSMRRAVRRAVEQGMPTVAECGGFLYLGQSLEDGNGKAFPMVGALPGCGVRKEKLVRFGYSLLSAKKDSMLFQVGEQFPVHEFHYWDSTENGTDLHARKPVTGRGWDCGFAGPNLYAAFPHLYFAGAPVLAQRFVRAARKFKTEGSEKA